MIIIEQIENGERERRYSDKNMTFIFSTSRLNSYHSITNHLNFPHKNFSVRR